MTRTQSTIESQKRYIKRNPEKGVNATRKWRQKNADKMAMYRKKAHDNKPHIIDYHIFLQFRRMFS